MNNAIVSQADSPPQAPTGRAHLDTDRIALAIATTEARLGRKGLPYHVLRDDSAELQSLHGRAAVALNLGSQDALDTALADATLSLANQHPQLVVNLAVADAFARTVIAAWLTSMSTKGER